MILLIGGKGQGKLDYALERAGADESQVAHDAASAANAIIFDRAGEWVRSALAVGLDPVAEMERLLHQNPEIILIFDEVGCGVVPLEEEERRWREAVGRMTCALAQRAQRVERLICGIPMTLKGVDSWN